MRNYPCRNFKSTLRERLFPGGEPANEAQKWAGFVKVAAMAQEWANPMSCPELGNSWMEDGGLLYALAMRLTECRTP
jgi:hypothetical protein